MKILKILSVALLIVVMPLVALAQLTVPQGGTGQTGFTGGYIPYGGSSSLRLDREAAFTYSASLNRLTVDNASTTGITATTICLSGDTCISTWPTGGGGSSKWTDGGTFIYPATGEYVSATYFTGTSTTATSTFINAGMTNLSALSSAGLIVRSNSNSAIVDFGAGGGTNATFYGGLNIDGATRLATSINGVLQANAGAVTATTTGTLTESVTGLQFDNTRVLIGGSAVLSLTSGYSIPLTTSTTEWAGFYSTPSTRITAGNGLAWSGNTLSATSTHAAVTLSGALDYITLVGQDIVRGAIDLATDITGALGIANGGLGAAYTDPNADQIMFWDDSVGAIKSLTTLAGAAISGTTLTINDVTCTDCLTSTEIADEYLFNTGDVGTGSYDFGGATSFEIVNGSNPTVDTLGEIALDTTGNQLVVATSSTAAVIPVTDVQIWAVTIASTSPAFINSGLYPVPTKIDGYTITRIQCHVTSGTSKVIAIEDASANSSEDITCATTNTTDDGTITNPIYTASELSYIDFGATTGAVDYVSISVFGNWTRE